MRRDHGTGNLDVHSSKTGKTQEICNYFDKICFTPGFYLQQKEHFEV